MPPLWHYTDGRGLLGILDRDDNDRVLWATHVLYMNDEEEYAFAFKMARDLLERIYALADLAKLAPRFADAIDRDFKAVPVVDEGIFVVSFSEEMDDLSQWRGYTTPGDGYVLGFDGNRLGRNAAAHGWRLEGCLYGQEAEGGLARMLRSAFEHYLRDSMPETEGGIATALHGLRTRLAEVAPALKHDAFKGEREWRLISPPLSRDKWLFRGGRSFVVPYVQFALPRNDEHPIVGIGVGPGPNAELAKRAVGALLQKRQVGAGLSGSGAPYRPW